MLTMSFHKWEYVLSIEHLFNGIIYISREKSLSHKIYEIFIARYTKTIQFCETVVWAALSRVFLHLIIRLHWFLLMYDMKFTSCLVLSLFSFYSSVPLYYVRFVPFVRFWYFHENNYLADGKCDKQF